MPIEAPDGFGKQVGGAVALEVKLEEKRFGEFADQDEIVSYVRKRLNEFESRSAAPKTKPGAGASGSVESRTGQYKEFSFGDD